MVSYSASFAAIAAAIGFYVRIFFFFFANAEDLLDWPVAIDSIISSLLQQLSVTR